MRTLTARLTRPFAAVAVLLAAVGAAVSIPAQASAASVASAPTPQLLRSIATPMHVGGFDPAVARAHGYEVRTSPDGTQYPVKSGSSATVTPDNVVSGDCGFSYVYEYGIGNRAVELYTGYSVVSSVYQWYWQVRLDDRGGSSYRNWEGGANNGIWQVDQVVGGLTRGGARATVISYNSVAFLDNGWICYSGGPFATTTIT